MNATPLATPLSRDKLIAKYDGRAPRYTSYPTAVQFKPDVTAETYRGWLANLSPNLAVSLYLHIPFCHRLCWYCGCNTRAVNHHEPVRDYVAFLVSEIRILQRALPGRLAAEAVHFGGGTPNMLSTEELGAIFGALQSVFGFTATPEVSVEIDPALLTRDWVRAAAGQGLSRASLGVQNLAADVQAAVNRVESFEHIAAGVGWLREFGVRSINIDLMYGLPHQTVANTLASVEQVLTLRPERLALFGYAHVPWMKAHQKLLDEATLPKASARLDQSEAAAERLVAAGYVRIGLDHFALPSDDLACALVQGRLHRNFQGYTTDAASTILGLGVSAIGSLPGGFVQNISQEVSWRAAIAADTLPIVRGVPVTPDDRFRAEIIERLMCAYEVDLAEVCARHGRAPSDLAAERRRIAAFVDDGLAQLDGNRLVIPEAGRPLVRSVCAVFDMYFDQGVARHSKAL
jgi:oxygen-independent coproporphyrinogen-3 oxidase